MKFRRIFAALIVTIAAATSAMAANITSTSLRIQGAGLRVLDETITTGIDLPSTVQTQFGGKTNDEAVSIEGVAVVGDLTGPGLDAPIQLTTAPGHKFEIPGLKQIGTYYLQNIRMMKGTEFLQYATPSVVTITVADLLQTKVTVKQLTPEEIRARGIVIDARNFDVYEYTFTFIIKDQEVVVPFPVIIDPRTHEAFPVAKESPYSIPSPSLIEPPRWTPPTIITTEFGEGDGGFDFGKDQLDGEKAGKPVKIPAAIVIPNSLAVLHQFFAVGLMVTNGAPEGSDARLEDIYATLKIPNAVRTVKTTPTVALGAAVPVVEPTTGVTFLIAQGRGEAEWTLEGLQPGTHRIDIDVHATLKRTGQADLALRATPSASVVVHDPRFNINFSHPDTVRKGIEYSTYAFITNMSGTEQTITVNTGVQSCDTNPTANVCRLNGAQSDLLTIPANDMRLIEYRLRSGTTGRVFATAGTIDGDHLSANVSLHMGVSETGIPLSPATLIMPYYAQFVEPDVVSANLQLFGLGFSLATAPVNAMTAKFPRVIQTDVFQRAVDLSRAGQRIFITNSNPEVKRDSLVNMTLDLLGNGGVDLREWDALRRQEKSGRAAGAAGARQLEATGLANGATMRGFIDSMASATAWRSGYVAVLAHGSATGDRPYAVSLLGRMTERRAELPNEAASGWVRTLPYTDIDRFNGAGENGELALMGRWVEDVVARVIPAQDGPFSVEVIYPNTADGTLLKSHFDLTGRKDEALEILITRGDSALEARLPNGGIASTGSVATVSPEPLRILGARQDMYLDDYGHKVSVLYNRPVKAPEGVDLRTRFTGEIDFNKDSVVFKGPRPISAAALQDDRRTVNVTFDHVLSINAAYTIASGNLVDPLTSAEVSFPDKASIKIDNESPAAILYGKVLKGDNTPVPNSEVTIRQYKLTDGPEPTVPPQWDVTNADGAFLFEYVRREVEANYGGAYRAVAVTPDGKTTTVEGAVRLPNRVHYLNIQLLGRGSAEGYVRYDNGAVVANARVTVGSTMFEQFRSTTSDANGYYHVDDLPVGPLTFSAVDNDGNSTFAAAEIVTPGQVVAQNLSIYRKPFPGTGRVYGVVRRSDTNVPVAGAHVGVYSQGYGLIDGYTDTEGRFDFTKVPSGFVTLLASEWSISREAVALDFDLRADEVRQSDMLLSVRTTSDGHATLTGTVTREKVLAPGTYEPVPGALVKIDGYRIVTADANGVFTYDDIPTTFSERKITAYDPTTQRVKSVQVPTLTETGPNAMTIVIGAFDRGYGTIRVRLLNAGGAPVSGYRVIVPGYPPDILDDKGNGVYELKDVPAGTWQSIWAVPSGPRNIGPNGDQLADSRPYGDQLANGKATVLFNGHIAALTLRLPGEGTVRVKVRSQFDLITPVALGYSAWDENEQGTLPITLKASTEKNGQADWAVFPKIPALQGYTVTSLHPQYGYAAASGQLVFDGDFRDHTLQLNTLAKVTGTVYAIDGLTPIAGASVRIYNGRSDPGTQITGPDGRFEFFDQPSATGVTVVAEVTQSDIYRTGFAYAVTPPNGGVVEGMSVVLRKRGYVEGQVVYKDYKVYDPINPANNVADTTPNDYSDNAKVPLARFYLRELDFPSRDFGKSTAPLVADATGRFLINNVFVGPLRATGWDPNNEELRGDWTGSITEEGAEAAPKAYIAVGGGGVGSARITVVDPNQNYAEVPNAEVGIYRGGSRFDFTSTDGAGVAQFDELPVGTYSVSAYSKSVGRTSQSETLTITRDGISTARLRLEFSGMVDGTFIDPEANNKPVPGAAIRLTASNYSSQASTDVAGAFTFLGVREGSFRLDAKDTESNRRASANDAISILDPHRTVTLKLEPLEKLRAAVYLPDDYGNNSGVLAPPATIEVKQRCYVIAYVEHCEYRRELQGNPIDFTEMFKNESWAVTVREIGGQGRVIGTGGSFPKGAFSDPVKLVWPAYGDINVTVTQAGVPASGARVVMGGGGKTVTAYTDSEGKVSAHGMPLGNIYVQALSADERFSGSQNVTIQRQSVPATATIALGTYAGVTGTVIAEGGTGPSVGTRVVANFSGNTAEIRTDGSGKFTILGIPASTNGTVVSLTFIGPDDTTFGASRQVTVYPTTGIYDLKETVIDATPPQIEAMIPADGSTNVSPDSSLKIVFSEPLNTALIDTNRVQLVAADGGAQSYTLSWANEAANKFSITIKPTTSGSGFPLRSNTLYRVVVSNSLTDLTGHALPAVRGFSFTTSDYAEPRVLKFLPASPIKRATTFEFRFNEPIDPTPWQTNGSGVFHIYKIAAPGGANAAILADLGGRAFVDPATNMTLFLAPDDTHPIEPESFYRVVFSGVRDPQGNITPEQTFHYFSFDEVEPVAVFVSPAAGAQLVSGSEYELKLELHNGSESGSIATDIKKVEYFTVAEDGTETPFAAPTAAPFSTKIIGPEAPVSGTTLKVGAQPYDTSDNRGPKAYGQWTVKPNAAPVNVVVTPTTPSAYPSNNVSAIVTFEDEGSFASVTTSISVPRTGTTPYTKSLTQSYDRLANGQWPEVKFTFTLPADAVADAAATLTTTVADVRGLTSAAATANIAIAEDHIQPTIISVTPAPGSTYFKDALFTIVATVSDAETSVKTVSFLVDGESVATASSGAGTVAGTQKFTSVQVKVPAKAEDTQVPIVVTAADYNGNTRSTTYYVTYKGVYDPDAPKVTWLCPIDRAAIPADIDNFPLPVKVRAIDADLSSVKFRVEGTTTLVNAGTPSGNDYPGTITFTKTPSTGTVTITAIVTDAAQHVVELPVTLDVIHADYVFTDPKAITPEQASAYDGKTIVLFGTNAQLAPQSPLKLANLLVLNGAKLQTLATTVSKEYRVDVTVSGVLYVDCASSIDQSNRGYVGGWANTSDGQNADSHGRTIGNTNTGGAETGAQGSHAGMGGNADGNYKTNAAYGSIFKPTELGSGGGGSPSCCTMGGSGGGAIALHGSTADTDTSRIVIAGTVAADGNWGFNGSVQWAGGAGGSVWIEGKQVLLSPVAKVTANGGDDDGSNPGSWGAGGGRVAVTATTKLDLSTAAVEARGGRNWNQGETRTVLDGGAGTVYVRRPGQERGELAVSSYDSRFPSSLHLTRFTPLGRIGRGTATSVTANGLTDTTRTFDKWMIGEELIVGTNTARTFTVVGISADGKTLNTDPADGSLLEVATAQPVVYSGALVFDSVTAGARALLRFDDSIVVGSSVDDKTAIAADATAAIVLPDDVPSISVTTTPVAGSALVAGSSISAGYSATSVAGVGSATLTWSPVGTPRVDVFTSYPSPATATNDVLSIPDTMTAQPATLTVKVVDRADRSFQAAPLQYQIAANVPPVIDGFTLAPSLSFHAGTTAVATVTSHDDLAVKKVTLTGTLGSAALSAQVHTPSLATASDQFNVVIPKDTAGGTVLTLKASVEDLSTGHTAVQSDTITATILTDTVAPQITVAAPLANAVFQESSINKISIRLTAIDAEVDVKEVVVQIDGGPATPLVRTNGSNEWKVDVAVPPVEGTAPVPVQLTFTARDYANNASTATVPVTVQPNNDPNAPTVSWVCSSSNAMYTPNYAAKLRVYAVGSSGGNGVTKVEFFIGGSTTPILATSLGNNLYETPTPYTIPDVPDGTVIDVIAVATSVNNLSTDTRTRITVVRADTPVVTQDFVISSANAASYTGKTVVVQSGTLTIEGPFTLDRLIVLGGKVTHRATDTTTARALDLTVTRGVYVACNASLDVSGRGYTGSGRTYPNVSGGSAGSAGGSHGGRGGWWFGDTPAQAYGSIFDPDTPGGASGTGEAGGGVIRLNAKQLIVDGGVYANGSGGTSGGAGGSILLRVDALGGAGEVRADGGISNANTWTGYTYGYRYRGSGGGGRVAVYAQSVTLDRLKVTAASGGNTDATRGAQGTVYFRFVDAAGKRVSDELVADNRGSVTPVISEPVMLGETTVVSVSGATIALTGTVPQWLTGSYIEIVDANDDVVSSYEIAGRTDNSVTVVLPSGVTSANAPAGAKARGYFDVSRVTQRNSAYVSMPAVGSENLTITGTVEVSRVRANSLTLASGVLTHPDTGRLDITAGTMTVDASSSVDVSGRGYQDAVASVGRTWPNTFTGGSVGGSGGSHGGRGGAWFGDPVAEPYGKIHDPDTPGGAGGFGGDCYGCTAGGGVARIKATTLTVNGKILANGRTHSRGGAGGSIRIDAATLQGSGEIRADGGISNANTWTGYTYGYRYLGSGGGGRIAIYTQTLLLDPTKITAASPGNTAQTRGAAGTVYLATVNATGVTTADELVLDGRGSAEPQSTTLILIPSGTVTAVNGDVVTLSTAVPSHAVGAWIEFLDAAGNRIASYPIVAVPSTSSVRVKLAAGEASANAPVGSTFRTFWAFSKVTQRNGAYVQFEALGGGDVTLSGSIETTRISAKNLTLTGATVTHPALTRLDVDVTDTLRVDSASSINVSGRGYQDSVSNVGRTWPGSFADASAGGSGGSHGGRGGAWFGDPVGRTYGNLFDPNTYGAAGGYSGDCNGCTAGGGILRIRTRNLILDGKLYANGNTESRGGAGGSIRIDADSFSGTGEVHADGGMSTSNTWTGYTYGYRYLGSGGGGRVAVYYNTMSFDRTKITAGTSGNTYETRGGGGTIYLKSPLQQYGDLIVDSRVSTPQLTQLPALSYGRVTSISAANGSQVDTIGDAYATLLAPDQYAGLRLFLNGNQSQLWPVLANTATSVRLDVSAAPLTAQVGDSYRGLYWFDSVKLRNAKLASHDEIRSQTAIDKDASSSVVTNSGPPVFAQLASIVVESSAAGDFVVAPKSTVTDADTPIHLVVTNVVSGAKTASVDAAADGSFRVPVTGKLGDTFTITATDNHVLPASSSAAVNGTITEYNAAEEVTTAPAAVTGGSSATGVLRLRYPARRQTVVALSSSSASATVPSSVIVPVGLSSVDFTIDTSSTAADAAATITATLAGSSASVTLTVLSGSTGVTSLSLTPNPLQGGDSITATVVLGGPAPAGGAVVSISSSDLRYATVPQTVVVPAGATSAAFTVSTYPVAAQSSVSITATYGATATATATLNACTALDVATPPSSVDLGTTWVDDAVPTGATKSGDGVFDSTQFASGSMAAHLSGAPGVHTLAFTGATTPLAIAPTDRLVVWALINPCNPPKQILIGWKAGTTEYRASWGESRIEPTVLPGYAGTIPMTGEWTRLEVLASSLGIAANVSATELSIRTQDGEAWFDAVGKKACVLAQAERPAFNPSEVVWFDDTLPAGAQEFSVTSTRSLFKWDTAQVASGTKSHKEALQAGLHEHAFQQATQKLSVGPGDVLYAYVLIDPCNPPKQVMLNFFDGTDYEHRAYWGESMISWGTDGTVSRQRVGPMPEAGKWVRLEVPAALLGLENHSIDGAAFALYDGQAWFDRSGKMSRVNLALNKTATQSSTFSDATGSYPAQGGVDGSTAGDYPNTKFAITQSTAQPWFQVDLGAVKPIESIELWTRTDAYTDRLNNFYVSVSDEPFTSTSLSTTLAQPGVSNYYFSGVAPTSTMFRINRTGQYVRVQLVGSNFLQLAEVQVWAPASDAAVNLAGGRVATQSSECCGGAPQRAVDGNTSGYWNFGSVSHTSDETGPYWDLDLGSLQRVSSVEIYNRTDCCMQRIQNFYLFISDTPFTLKAAYTTTLAQAGVSAYYRGTVNAAYTIPVDRVGRYVRLQLTDYDAIHMAEVQVWGASKVLGALSTTPPEDEQK